MIIHSKRIYMEDGLKSGYLEIEGRVIKNFYEEGSEIKADIDYGKIKLYIGNFYEDNRIIAGTVRFFRGRGADLFLHHGRGGLQIQADDSFKRKDEVVSDPNNK